jgi:hypothetical protein
VSRRPGQYNQKLDRFVVEDVLSEVVWKLPFPSSGLSGVYFQMLLGRSCALVCDDDENSPVRIVFDGVEAFKCTYHNSCTVEMVETYDRLSDLGRTPWLDSVRRQLSRSGETVEALRHLMIYFDDGPCYEFICRGFRVEDEAAT